MTDASRPMARAAFLACGASTVSLLALLWWTGTAVHGKTLVQLGSPVVILLALHLTYSRLRPEPRIANVCGGLCVFVWSGGASALAALAALRSGAPLIDPMLAQFDLAFGFDSQALVAWMSTKPLMTVVLAVAYGVTVPAVGAVIVFHGVTRRAARMWECAFVFAAGATFCSFTLAFLPAVAAFAHYGTPEEVQAALPVNAGRFFLATIETFRSGAVDTIRLEHLEGVGTFPSFHATMAMIIAWGMRGLVGLFIPACVLAALILVATVVIGGHYVVDLPAGVALYAACILLFRLGASWSIGSNQPPSSDPDGILVGHRNRACS